MSKRYDTNVLVISGHIATDITGKDYNGQAIAKFLLANTYGETDDKSSTSFINVVLFGKIAETCQQYLSKGSKVLVTGRIKENRWNDNGKKKSKIELYASNVEFLSNYKKKDDNNTNDYEDDGTDIPF